MMLGTGHRLDEVLPLEEVSKDLYFFDPAMKSPKSLLALAAQKLAEVTMDHELIPVLFQWHQPILEMAAERLRGRHLVNYLEIRGGLAEAVKKTTKEEDKEGLLLAVVREAESSDNSSQVRVELMLHLNRCWLDSVVAGRVGSDKRDSLRIVDLGLAHCATPPIKFIRDTIYARFVENHKDGEFLFGTLAHLPLGKTVKSNPAVAHRLRVVGLGLEPAFPVSESATSESDPIGDRELCYMAENCLKAGRIDAHHVVLAYALPVLSRLYDRRNRKRRSYAHKRGALVLLEQLACSLGVLQAPVELTAGCLLRLLDLGRRFGLSRLPSFRLRYETAVHRFLTHYGFRWEEMEAFEHLMRKLEQSRNHFLKAVSISHLVFQYDTMLEDTLALFSEKLLHPKCPPNSCCLERLEELEKELVERGTLQERLIQCLLSRLTGDRWFHHWLNSLFYAGCAFLSLFSSQAKTLNFSRSLFVVEKCLEGSAVHRTPFIRGARRLAQHGLESGNFLRDLRMELAASEKLPLDKEGYQFTSLAFAFLVFAFPFSGTEALTASRRKLFLDEAEKSLLNLTDGRHPRFAWLKLCQEIMAFSSEDHEEEIEEALNDFKASSAALAQAQEGWAVGSEASTDSEMESDDERDEDPFLRALVNHMDEPENVNDLYLEPELTSKMEKKRRVLVDEYLSVLASLKEHADVSCERPDKAELDLRMSRMVEEFDVGEANGSTLMRMVREQAELEDDGIDHCIKLFSLLKKLGSMDSAWTEVNDLSKRLEKQLKLWDKKAEKWKALEETRCKVLPYLDLVCGNSKLPSLLRRKIHGKEYSGYLLENRIVEERLSYQSKVAQRKRLVALEQYRGETDLQFAVSILSDQFLAEKTLEGFRSLSDIHPSDVFI